MVLPFDWLPIFSCSLSLGWLSFSFDIMVLERFLLFFRLSLEHESCGKKIKQFNEVTTESYGGRLLRMIHTCMLSVLDSNNWQIFCNKGHLIHMIHYPWVLFHSENIELFGNSLCSYLISHHIQSPGHLNFFGYFAFSEQGNQIILHMIKQCNIDISLSSSHLYSNFWEAKPFLEILSMIVMTCQVSTEKRCNTSTYGN